MTTVGDRRVETLETMASWDVDDLQRAVWQAGHGEFGPANARQGSLGELADAELSRRGIEERWS